MPPSVIFLHGSPRARGNTRIAAGWAMDAAREKGASVDEVNAASLRHEHPGCISCYKCQQSDSFRCVLDDEVSRVVAGLPEYDAIVLATPVYWFSYPAQLKIVIDRMFSLVKFDPQGTRTPLEGKTMALLATGGGPLEANLDLLEAQWRIPAQFSKARFKSCLIPNTTYNPKELPDSARDKAVLFGRSLVD